MLYILGNLLSTHSDEVVDGYLHFEPERAVGLIAVARVVKHLLRTPGVRVIWSAAGIEFSNKVSFKIVNNGLYFRLFCPFEKYPQDFMLES